MSSFVALYSDIGGIFLKSIAGYYIYGAGDTGKRAMDFVGWNRVIAFIDNFLEGEINDKPIIPFTELEKIYSGQIIIVASTNYENEFIKTLIDAGINRFFSFHIEDTYEINNCLPQYCLFNYWQPMSYSDIVDYNKIYNYCNILIIGGNPGIKYLINEIFYQSSFQANIRLYSTQEYLGTSWPEIRRLGDLKQINQYDCILYNDASGFNFFKDKFFDGYTGRLINLFTIDKFVFSYSHPELERFHNIHKNEQCFIIGNGPSLSSKDLETLRQKKIFSFASNKIYKIFEYSEWRPDCYCVSDGVVLSECENFIESFKQHSLVFLSDEYNRSNSRRFKDVNYVHVTYENWNEKSLPSFSYDITEQVFWGRTVTYDLMLQIAMYMGFTRIYLLGMDNSYRKTHTYNEGYFNTPHFYSSDESDAPEVLSISKGWDYRPELVNYAYQAARKAAEQHGVKIINATRGGELEVFERVDFDSLFS